MDSVSKIIYINLKDINTVQQKIMRFVETWAHSEKTPIPKVKLVSSMKDQGVKEPTILNSISVLLKRGYIRRAVGTSNKTYYVQIRKV